VQFTFIDNGDDKVCLEVNMDNEKKLSIICDLFIPVTEPSKVMVAASGQSVQLREMSLKQMNRTGGFRSGISSQFSKHEDCCCSIF